MLTTWNLKKIANCDYYSNFRFWYSSYRKRKFYLRFWYICGYGIFPFSADLITPSFAILVVPLRFAFLVFAVLVVNHKMVVDKMVGGKTLGGKMLQGTHFTPRSSLELYLVS